MKDYATKFLNKKVKIIIDRKLGTKHPRSDKIFYAVNYGYLPSTKAPDGEEVDAYILGVFEPIEEFEGKCIAVIHRTDDDDDKLIVVPESRNFNDDEIRALTEFQERFFESVIIRE